jgi:hypothetical protein
MKRDQIALVVLLALVVLGCGRVDKPEAAVPIAQKTGYGIMETAGEVVVSRTPETTSGLTRTATVMNVVDQTSRIPAQIGIRFGFKYLVTNFPASTEIVLTKITKHPLIQKPDGTTSHGYAHADHRMTSPQGTTVEDVHGYGFDHPYELVPGKWTVELWYEEQKLVEHTFDVYEP